MVQPSESVKRVFYWPVGPREEVLVLRTLERTYMVMQGTDFCREVNLLFFLDPF